PHVGRLRRQDVSDELEECFGRGPPPPAVQGTDGDVVERPGAQPVDAWRSFGDSARCGHAAWRRSFRGNAPLRKTIARRPGRRPRIPPVAIGSSGRAPAKRPINRLAGKLPSSVALADERAFDTAVRRKPLAGAADAVYGNSIDFRLKIIARSGIRQKRCY